MAWRVHVATSNLCSNLNLSVLIRGDRLSQPDPWGNPIWICLFNPCIQTGSTHIRVGKLNLFAIFDSYRGTIVDPTQIAVIWTKPYRIKWPDTRRQASEWLHVPRTSHTGKGWPILVVHARSFWLVFARYICYLSIYLLVFLDFYLVLILMINGNN